MSGEALLMTVALKLWTSLQRTSCPPFHAVYMDICWWLAECSIVLAPTYSCLIVSAPIELYLRQEMLCIQHRQGISIDLQVGRGGITSAAPLAAELNVLVPEAVV